MTLHRKTASGFKRLLAAAAMLALLAGCGAAPTEPAGSARSGETGVEAVTAESAETGAPAVSRVELTPWQEINGDVYAFLDIPGTGIQYPVLQHPEDDSYYLDHNIDGSGPRPGVIYTELWNSRDWSDFNTVIYGHDMNDGTMFGRLENYRDEAFFEAHDTILIHTPDSVREYRIFAAVVANDGYIPYLYHNFETEAARTQFLEDILTLRELNSIVRQETEVGPGDHIITLSTCISGQPEKRYLVLARFVGEHE